MDTKVILSILLFGFIIGAGCAALLIFVAEKIINKSNDIISDNGTVLAKSAKLYSNYKEFQPNKKNDNAYDCTIRSLCAYYDIKWKDAFEILSNFTRDHQIMFNNEECLKMFFKYYDFSVGDIKDKSISFSEACKIYTEYGYSKFFILGNNHIVCCKDGKILDSWDSRKNKAYTIFAKRDMTKCHTDMTKCHMNNIKI